MKKIYSLMMVAILAMVSSFSAMAEVTFTLNIDNPQAVIAKIDGQETPLEAGDNEFTVEEYTAVSVSAVAPYSMTVTDESGEKMGVFDNTWYFYPSSGNTGKFTIKTINLDETRTASCKVNIDAANMVSAILSGTFSKVSLENGENIVKFNPEVETVLTITAVSYTVPLYKVTLDGENVASENGAFSVPLAEGCTIDITAVIPEKEVTVKFNYSNEESFGVIDGVQINYVPVENFDGLSFTAMAGSTVSISANDDDYKINSFAINGEKISWTGSYAYTFVIIDDTEIAIDAAPYGTITATVLVDDPENFILYRGYDYYNDVIALEAGKNTLEMSENSTLVSWKPANGCLITTVLLNDQILPEYPNYATLADGDVLEFITSKIVMDKKFVFWIDDRSAADSFFSFAGSDRTSVDVATGYNIVEYYSAMNPFYLSWYSDSKLVNKVYVNGEYLEPLYEESTTYELAIDNNSVVKVFLATEPEECSVKVNVNDDPEVTVAYDIVTPVTEFPAEINVFKGTLFTVTPAAEENVSVLAGGIEVAQNEDGIYEIEITDPSTEITIAKTSAIKSVMNETINGDIYNMMGVKVGNSAELNQLPAGIYILNGKKIIK